jgi:hypothetical protein
MLNNLEVNGSVSTRRSAVLAKIFVNFPIPPFKCKPVTMSWYSHGLRAGSLGFSSLNHNSKLNSKLCYFRRSVGQSVLVSSTHLGPKARFLLLSDICGFVVVGRLLWREDGSVVYNCCWSPSAESLSGTSPTGFLIVFYCLRFGTSPTWRVRSPYLCPPGTGWPSYTPRHWVPF